MRQSEIQSLAIAVHDHYNQTSLRIHPEKQLTYPTFTDLPAEKQAYNLRVVSEWPRMLAKVNCEIKPADSPGEKITAFTPAEIEVLAECEHDRWTLSRREFGWKYGPVYDEAARTHPEMIPYAGLSEEVKEFDRDPARDIPTLLKTIGKGVFRKKRDLGLQ